MGDCVDGKKGKQYILLKGWYTYVYNFYGRIYFIWHVIPLLFRTITQQICIWTIFTVFS